MGYGTRNIGADKKISSGGNGKDNLVQIQGVSMIDIKYIKERKQFLVDEHHSKRVILQKQEQQYYDDEFPVNVIKAPQYLSRTGTAAWLIDGPASHIITRNPQVFVEPKKKTQGARDSAYLVNALLKGLLPLASSIL